MQLFLLNLLLALFWAVVSGSFTPGGLLTGFLIGYVILLVARPVFGRRAYYQQFWRALAFVAFFLKALVASSLRVAKDVLTPNLTAVPGVVAYPLSLRTEPAITVLACTISLTPGTLSLDVSDDRSTLYVHSMYDGDRPEVVRAGLRELEVRVQRVMEPDWVDLPAPAAAVNARSSPSA